MVKLNGVWIGLLAKIVWSSFISYCIDTWHGLWHRMEWYCWHHMAFYGMALYGMALYAIALYGMQPYFPRPKRPPRGADDKSFSNKPPPSHLNPHSLEENF